MVVQETEISWDFDAKGARPCRLAFSEGRGGPEGAENDVLRITQVAIECEIFIKRN